MEDGRIYKLNGVSVRSYCGMSYLSAGKKTARS